MATGAGHKPWLNGEIEAVFLRTLFSGSSQLPPGREGKAWACPLCPPAGTVFIKVEQQPLGTRVLTYGRELWHLQYFSHRGASALGAASGPAEGITLIPHPAHGCWGGAALRTSVSLDPSAGLGPPRTPRFLWLMVSCRQWRKDQGPTELQAANSHGTSPASCWGP